MAERSVKVVLRADITDLKAKAQEASRSLDQAAKTAEQANKRTGASGSALAKQNDQFARKEEIRAQVRQQAADDEIRSAEKRRLAQEEYGKTTATVLEHQDQLNRAAAGMAVTGLALAAGVGVAVKAYADFDEQMSAVSATGEDARSNYDALRETALELGADTAFSAGEAAQGVENLLKAGVSAQDVIGGGLKGALDLAAAGQLGVADAAEIAATAMTQFGLAGEDVPHIADLLAAGAGKAQGEVSDMAQALNQSGLVASQFGLSIEDTAGTLSAFASAGLIGSDAGTSFRTMLLRLANPADETAETMEELGIQAYDAQGQFVGITNLAQQLQDRLGNLTQAQRDAALAQIFGSDAIRAANILYDQGAAGLQDWINQTNDAGYASEVAAIQTDNLAGDIERLGGALDSALIESGGGANDVMRDLAQGAEGLIEAVGSLDSSTLELGLKIAVVTAGVLLLGATGLRMATGLAAARAALIGLGVSAPAAAAGLRSVAVAAGPVVVALGLLMAAGYAQNRQAEAMQTGADEWVSALQRMAAGSEEATAEINANFDGVVGGIDGINDAMRLLDGAIGPIESAGTAFFDFTSSIVGAEGPTKMYEERIQELDAALTQLAPAEAGKAFSELAEQMADIPIEDQIAHFDDYANKLRALAEEQGITNLSQQELYDWMQGNVPPRVQQAARSNEIYEEAIAAAGEAGLTTADQLEALTEAMDQQAEAALAASDAQIGFEAAIDAAADSIKENGRTLDVNTEKGRANQQSLNQLASSTRRYVDALDENNASQAEINQAMTRGFNSYVQTAVQMGQNANEAAKLAISLGLIPTEVSPEITAPGVKVTQAQVDEVNESLESIDPTYRAEIISAFMRDGYQGYLNAFNNVKDKTARITTEVQTVYLTPKGRPPAGGGPVATSGNADGGYITGPGGPRDDLIPTWLSNGEVVIRAAAVDQLGVDRLLQMNATGQWPRFANGGLVGAADGLRFAAGGSVSMGPINALVRAIADPMGEIVAAQRQAASALSASASASRLASREQAELAKVNRETARIESGQAALVRAATSAANRATASRTSLGKRQDREETALDDRIDAARKRIAKDEAGTEAAIDRLQREKKRKDRDLDDRLEAARKRKNGGNEVARIEAEQKRSDRSYEDRIQAYRDSNPGEAKRLKELARLQAAREKMTRDHAREMVSADEKVERSAKARDKAETTRDSRVRAAQRTQTRAQAEYDRAAERAKDRADRLRQSQEELAQAQQRVADTARQAAEGFRQQYQSGGDLADLIEQRQTGAREMAALDAQVKRLRQAGLAESIIQDEILGRSVSEGSELAAQIISAGQKSLTQLNAAEALAGKTAQQLGLTQATERGLTPSKLIPLAAVRSPGGSQTTLNQTFTQVDPNAAYLAFMQRAGAFL